MSDLKFWVYRRRTERPDDIDAQKVNARERARILHALADTFGFEVKEWGKTQQQQPPKEVVEIIVTLASAGLFTALVNAFQAYITGRKLGEVKLILPDGGRLEISGATKKEILSLIEALNLTKDRPEERFA